MSVVGTVAAVAAIATGNPQFAAAAYAIGSGVESVINPQQIEGPRLDDLEVQMASYGSAIPFEYGTNRHAGTIIWPKIIELDEHEETESAKGGPEQTTYSYSASFAVLICEGPIAGVRRIWANKKIIYDATGESDTPKDPAISGLRFYLGTEGQQPDPLIEATDGPSPAYLGYAYCVFEDLGLTDFANRPPQLEFEVLTKANTDLPDAIPIGKASGAATVDPNTKYIWSSRGFNSDRVEVYISDNVTMTTINTIVVDSTKFSLAGSMGNSICYVASRDEMVVANENGTDVLVFDATNQVFKGSYDLFTWMYQCISGYKPPPGRSWSGLVRYDSFNDQIVIGSTNLASWIAAYTPHGWNSTAVDPCDSSKLYIPNLHPKYTLTFQPDDVYSIDQLMFHPENGMGLAVTNGFATVFQNGTILHEIESEYISTTNRAAYDTKRNRGVILRDTVPGLLLIDANTGMSEYYAYEAPDFAPPTASMAFRDVMYHAQNDKFYVTATQAGLSFTLYTINAETLAIEAVNLYSGPTNRGTMIEVPGETGYFVFADSGTLQAYRIPLASALEPEQISLGYIVSDICQRAGLSPAEIDVSQLMDLVDGYIVPRQMSARAAIEPLQTAFFFDAVESDDKIKFVKRGAGSPVTIPMEDRAAREFGSDLPDSLSIVRAQDMELPVQIDVEYADIDADHLVGNQYSRRITKDTKTRVNIQSPVVMDAVKAKQVADVTLYRAWLNQTYKFQTTRKWAHVEPTDIVVLPTLEASYTARIVSKREQPSGIIEWEAAMEGVEVYTQSGAGAAPTNYVKQSIYAPGSTMLQLLDIPMLRDEDNNAGFYDVMAGSSASWTGAQLFKSADGGSTYEPIHITSDPATIGTTQSALPDFTAGNIPDEGSSVTVVMKSGAALTSVTDTQLYNGANLAVIGKPDRWEVIQFRTATLIAPKTYQLSGFLRGRRGTEWATGTHQAGDSFIIASPTGWNRLVANADVGLERKYKAPAFRMPLSSAPAQTFTNTGISLKPFAPVDLTGERDADGNLLMKWNRRTRMIGDTLHMARPLGEASEAYSIDILNGQTVLRTLTSSTPSVVYSAADQAVDGITPGAAVTAAVYQLSATVGRGYPLQGTV